MKMLGIAVLGEKIEESQLHVIYFLKWSVGLGWMGQTESYVTDSKITYSLYQSTAQSVILLTISKHPNL